MSVICVRVHDFEQVRHLSDATDPQINYNLINTSSPEKQISTTWHFKSTLIKLIDIPPLVLDHLLQMQVLIALW